MNFDNFLAMRWPGIDWLGGDLLPKIGIEDMRAAWDAGICSVGPSTDGKSESKRIREMKKDWEEMQRQVIALRAQATQEAE